jgi:hypothetical protein
VFGLQINDPAMISGADSLAASVLLPEGARAAGLIVCERTGRWAVALRRELTAANLQLSQTRALAACWELLAQAPASFLVVELTIPTVDELLPRIACLDRDFPLAHAAVVADRRLAAYQWLAREAGAVHFCSSPRQLGPLADIARRHLAHAPAPRQTITERIWASLPWAKP